MAAAGKVIMVNIFVEYALTIIAYLSYKHTVAKHCSQKWNLVSNMLIYNRNMCGFDSFNRDVTVPQIRSDDFWRYINLFVCVYVCNK